MYGFVRVAAATPLVTVADVKANEKEIIRLIESAKEKGVSLVVFPELALCGYTVGDLLLQSTLLNACEQALLRIAEHTDGIAAVVGTPISAGGKLYDAAAVLSGGKIIGAAVKANIPNYCEFYEARYFASSGAPKSIEIGGAEVPFGFGLVFREKSDPRFSFGVEICEDMWVASSPSAKLARGGANIICNPSASVETVGKAEFRRTLVKAHSAKLLSGYVYADCGTGESTTDCVFAGHRIIAEDGALVADSGLFSEGLTVSEIDVEKLDFSRRQTNTFTSCDDGITYVTFEAKDFKDGLNRRISPTPFLPEEGDGERAELILSLQTEGLKKRMSASHSENLVVGISGGLDSALALLVAVRAAKAPENVTAITMPCFGTGERTLKNARALCAALGVNFREIPIKEAVKKHFEDIGHDADKHDTVYENSQARERTQVLMDIANGMGALVVGTGDMSELALGWTTYNGDHMSSYGVNGSIPKTLVKYLVLYVANRLGGAAGKALGDIADTEISPELLPPASGKITQKTEEILGKYAYHDFFLYHVVRWGRSPEKIMYLAGQAFGKERRSEIKAAMKVFYSRFFSQQFKRSCIPDGAKVGTVSLSPRSDFRMPSDAVAALWLEEVEKL